MYKYPVVLMFVLSLFLWSGCATNPKPQTHNPFDNHEILLDSQKESAKIEPLPPPGSAVPSPNPEINYPIAPAPTPTPEPWHKDVKTTKTVIPNPQGTVPKGSIVEKKEISNIPQTTLEDQTNIRTSEFNSTSSDNHSINSVSGTLPKKDEKMIPPILPKKKDKTEDPKKKNEADFNSYAGESKSSFVNTGQEKAKKEPGSSFIPSNGGKDKELPKRPLPTLPKKDDNKKEGADSKSGDVADPSTQTFSAPVHPNSLEPVRPMMIPVSSQSSSTLLPEPAKLREVHFRTIVE